MSGACERDLEIGNYTRVWNVPAEIKETTRRFSQSLLVVARVASFVVCALLRGDGFDRWPRTTHGSVCETFVFFSHTSSNRGVKKTYKTEWGVPAGISYRFGPRNFRTTAAVSPARRWVPRYLSSYDCELAGGRNVFILCTRHVCIRGNILENKNMFVR